MMNKSKKQSARKGAGTHAKMVFDTWMDNNGIQKGKTLSRQDMREQSGS